MEELQARIKAIRALRTEMNLARQPDSELLDASEADCQGEASIVEMPERALDTAEETRPVSRSRRKSQSSSKRKSQTPASKQKPLVPFRQLRENQQPFMDDLKRLEAQAERINQILAERSRPQYQQEQPDDEPEMRSQATPAGRTRSSPGIKQSSKGSKQANRSYDEGEELQMAALDDEDTENLKIQAERIHQLLAELEETIRQAGAIAQEPQRITNSPRTVTEGENRLRRLQDSSPILEYRRSPEPSTQFQARQVQTQPQGMPQKNVKRAVQEAAETAQALRYLTNRESSSMPNGTFNGNSYSQLPHSEAFWQKFPQPHYAPQSQFSIKRLGLLQALFQVPQKPIDKLGDAVLWIVLSAVVRVGFQFLMMTYSAYSPLIIGLMLAPAALAVYLAIFAPKAEPVSVYRLFLIMLGLLLGGKLF
ncbi:hypothetical protein [Leptothermofonsia sp. ETS-13]|uniref:hypothetical protein n=1 Tax=Leptothermofonsia sp. ETS-13 TaxID=3035696 RepID=UPI003BA12DF7